jgi:hypothetical protein
MPVTEAISHHVIANAVKQSGFGKYEIATPLRELAMMFTEGFNDWILAPVSWYGAGFASMTKA